MVETTACEPPISGLTCCQPGIEVIPEFLQILSPHLGVWRRQVRHDLSQQIGMHSSERRYKRYSRRKLQTDPTGGYQDAWGSRLDNADEFQDTKTLVHELADDMFPYSSTSSPGDVMVRRIDQLTTD